MKVKATDYIELYYFENTNIYSWKFLPATEKMDVESLKETFQLMMDTLKSYNPEGVLANDKENFAVFTVDIQGWIAKTTIDTLKASNVKKFAIVKPEEFVSELATEQAVEEARKLADGIQIEMFFDETEATNWLEL